MEVKEENKEEVKDIETVSEVETKEKTVEEIPTFKAPESDEEIPMFSAPTVDEKYEGPVCKNHPNYPAVAQCARCGQNICKECAETCAVSSGEYANKNLCFDCCKELFEADKKELSKNRNKIMIQYILTIVGCVLGGAVGADSGAVMMLICIAIGGSLLAALKPIGGAMIDMFKGIIELASGGSIVGAIIQVFVGAINFLIVSIQCAIRTTIKLVKYTNYLIKANKAIKSDKDALKEIQDFMTYMAVKANNKNADIAKLMQEGGELYNNSYARMLVEKGEEAADAMLRVATTRIAENGEIIRTFVAE